VNFRTSDVRKNIEGWQTVLRVTHRNIRVTDQVLLNSDLILTEMTWFLLCLTQGTAEQNLHTVEHQLQVRQLRTRERQSVGVLTL